MYEKDRRHLFKRYFLKFESDDSDVKGSERSGRPQKCEDEQMWK